MPDQRMISVNEASQMLDVSERQVRRYCNDGKLVSKKDGKAFSINYDSVLALLRENPQPDADIETDTEEQENADMSATEQAEVHLSDNGNGNVRTVPQEEVRIVENGHTDVRKQEMSALDRTLTELHQRLDQHLQDEQTHTTHLKESLSQIVGDSQVDKEKLSKVQGTLHHLLDEIE